MKKLKFTRAALVLWLGVLVTACGSGGDDNGNPNPPPPDAVWDTTNWDHSNWQ